MKSKISDKKWLETLLRCFDRITDKFIGVKEVESLKNFMEDESNLYNPDGSLTYEYKRKIKEMESFVSSNSINDAIFEQYANDAIGREVAQGIIESVEERRLLMEDYNRCQDNDEQNFSSQKWIKNKLGKNTSEEDVQEKLNVEAQLTEGNITEMLQDETIKEGVKKTLK